MIKQIHARFHELGIDIDDNTSDMIAYWDQDLICRYANAAYVDWFGVHPDMMVDKMSLKTLLGDLYNLNLPYIEGALRGEVQVFERDIPTPFGQIRHCVSTYCPAFEDDDIIGFYVHVEDATVRNNDQPKYLHQHRDHHRPDPVNEVRITLESMLLKEFPGITRLARQHYLSESKLKKEFKTRFNKGIFAYYRFMQMEMAEVLIKEEKKTKKQVASILNFTNATNFITCYQKHLKEKASQKVIEELTKSNDDRYKTFITQAPFAIAMVDRNMIFQAASQKYIDDHNLHFKPIFGTSLYDVFPGTEQKWKKIHRSALRGKVLNGEDYVFERDNGSFIWIRWDIRPWRNIEGEIGGLLIFTEDITAVKLREQEKDKILEILNKASEVIRIGVWKKNFVDNTGFWSTITREILEVPDAVQPTAGLALHYYKEGKSRAEMEKVLNEAIELGKSFDVTVDIITAKGNEKTVKVIGYAEFRNGKCERLFGIYQEIRNRIKN